MIRRRLLLTLAGAALGASACAGQAVRPETTAAASGGAEPTESVDMLFISPMGEPFRAKSPAPYPVTAWFRQADADHDGKLTLKEFQADAERFFHVLDVNKDGVIDHREVYYYEHRLAPEIIGQATDARLVPTGPRLFREAAYLTLAQGPGGGTVMGAGAPPPGGDDFGNPRPGVALSTSGAAPFGLLKEPEPVEASDIRLSGRISLGDFRTRAEQRFRILDAAGRGYLTLRDLPETDVERELPRSLRRPASA